MRECVSVSGGLLRRPYLVRAPPLPAALRALHARWRARQRSHLAHALQLRRAARRAHLLPRRQRRGIGLLELLLTLVPAARPLAHTSPEYLPSSSATRRPRAPTQGLALQARQAAAGRGATTPRRAVSRSSTRSLVITPLKGWARWERLLSKKNNPTMSQHVEPPPSLLSRPRELCPGSDRLGPRTAHEVRAVKLELRA